MDITRRGGLRAALSFGSALTLGALAACSTAAANTPAQIVADAKGVVAALQAYLPLVVAADPALMPPDTVATITGGLNQAASIAAQISGTMTAAAGASALQQVDTYINAALAVLSAVTTAAPGSPLAPYVPAIQAAIALVPVIEAFVNATLGAVSTTAALRARAVVRAMTPAAARAILNIRAVG